MYVVVRIIGTLGKYDQEGCENLSALLILLIFYFKNSQKSNLSLENTNLKWEEISLWKKKFSNTHWPQLTAPFYSIFFETSICQFNSSKCSPIMPDEVREHLKEIRDHSFIQNLSRFLQIHSFFSSVHLTHFLQGSGQRTGMAIAEAWFCAQWPIFVWFLRFVFGLLYGWKIQTWPIIRFLTESVTCWFLSVGIW